MYALLRWKGKTGCVARVWNYSDSDGEPRLAREFDLRHDLYEGPCVTLTQGRLMISSVLGYIELFGLDEDEDDGLVWSRRFSQIKTLPINVLSKGFAGTIFSRVINDQVRNDLIRIEQSRQKKRLTKPEGHRVEPGGHDEVLGEVAGVGLEVLPVVDGADPGDALGGGVVVEDGLIREEFIDKIYVPEICL